jgi:hypothetical protein
MAEVFGRMNPKNRQHATALQLEDDVKLLKPHALLDNEKGFDNTITKIEMVIKAYRSKRLRNMCAKVQAKSKESNLYMKKNFPDMYKDMQKRFPHLYKD